MAGKFHIKTVILGHLSNGDSLASTFEVHDHSGGGDKINGSDCVEGILNDVFDVVGIIRSEFAAPEHKRVAGGEDSPSIEPLGVRGFFVVNGAGHTVQVIAGRTVIQSVAEDIRSLIRECARAGTSPGTVSFKVRGKIPHYGDGHSYGVRYPATAVGDSCRKGDIPIIVQKSRGEDRGRTGETASCNGRRGYRGAVTPRCTVDGQLGLGFCLNINTPAFRHSAIDPLCR